MQIRVEPRDQCSIVHLKGEFDSFQCKPFLERFRQLQEEGMRDVIINLLRVQFMNSTALGTLIKVNKICRGIDARLVLSSPSAFCRRTIESVGLQQVLTMFDSDEAAEQHLAGDRAAPEVDDGDVFSEDESAVLFFPVDSARTEQFIPREQRSAKANPVHGHAFGSSWRGVGRMAGLDADGVRFTWEGGKSGLVPARMAEMLAPETELQIKFRLPLMQRQMCEATVCVDSVKPREQDVAVTASFSKIAAKTMEAVHRYVKDIAYLKKELKTGE